MYHILLISENRQTLRDMYYTLEDSSKYIIHIIPFSTDAEKSFFDFHADIVILDESVKVPYQSILSAFTKSTWKYNVILISQQDKNMLIYDKNSFNKIHLREKIDRILSERMEEKEESSKISIDWKGNCFVTLNTDTHHIIYIKNFNKRINLNKETITNIEKRISYYAKINIIKVVENEILFFISRTDIKGSFSFNLLYKDISYVLGQKTVMIYDQSVCCDDFKESCMMLQKAASLSYFLGGCVESVKELNKHTETDENLIHRKCTELITSILNNDNIHSIHLLRDLYLNIIKKSQSFRTRDFVRMQINFIFSLLTKYSINFNYQSLEDELDEITSSALLRENVYHSDKLKDILINCVLKIYDSFSTDKSLEGIAQEMDRNKIYLNRIYKEHFEITILDTIQILKIEHAKYYLTNTNLKVSAIAEKTGFNDIGYFSKFFHNETGFTALEYRNRHESIMAI